MTAAYFTNVADELIDMRNVRLFPIPFENPGADSGLRRQAEKDFELLLRAGDVHLLVQAELDGLFERVDGIVAGDKEDDDVRISRLRLDQIRGEISGAERGEIA